MQNNSITIIYQFTNYKKECFNGYLIPFIIMAFVIHTWLRVDTNGDLV